MPKKANYSDDVLRMAASLYYVDGLGQTEVANLVRVSQTKISRLLAVALDRGIVRISVDQYDPRLKAIVSNCGFSSMRKDDVPSWNGKSYMPRIKSEFADDVMKLPFDFHEVVAAFAPRAFLAIATDKDNDFDVTGVQDVIAAATPIYKLHGAADRLAGHYPKAPHSFPADARKVAYEFLDKHLKK